MCGIIGGVAQRDLAPILLEGLRRLEYRGYDSAGMALLNEQGALHRLRGLGKVQQLAELLAATPLLGNTGVAHTRWATHGVPAERNAHPHLCNEESLALVHNGIIENHEALRSTQQQAGYTFHSETDSEVVVHLLRSHLRQGLGLLHAVQQGVKELVGAFALGVIDRSQPGHLVAARAGSPLVIGVGIGEHFIASDLFALLPVTQRFIFLEEGDVAELTRDRVRIWDRDGRPVERSVQTSQLAVDAAERGGYRHFMLKEIFEQPRAVSDTLEGRLLGELVPPTILGDQAEALLARVERVKIVACGTSYHAGMVGLYWLESLAGVACSVEVASEFRYRKQVIEPGTLFVTLSQSGETADTLAALRLAKRSGYVASLAVCNAPESSLVRESDLVLLTHAGPEIGVASTKAFTTQLVAMLLLVALLQSRNGQQQAARELVQALRTLPLQMERVLELDRQIAHLAESFVDRHHALFLGRGEYYPIALEGALKLKEISYIHAEAYPAGELKHGPLALIDEEMPVVAVAPDNRLLEKLKSNLEEVRARGARLIVFADKRVTLSGEQITRIELPATAELLAPILFTLPLQLLAYHVAVLRGTDVDQPRNLAKSVTVE